jgi:hypothetical protein
VVVVLPRSVAFAVVLISSLVLVPGGQAQALTPPSPPQDVEAAAVSGGIEVTWSPPVFMGGADSVTYRVYRDSSLVADGLDTTSFIDSSFTTSAGTTTYTVTAVNEVGESVRSGGPCVVLNTPPDVSPSNCVDLVISLVFWILEQTP